MVHEYLVPKSMPLCCPTEWYVCAAFKPARQTSQSYKITLVKHTRSNKPTRNTPHMVNIYHHPHEVNTAAPKRQAMNALLFVSKKTTQLTITLLPPPYVCLAEKQSHSSHPPPPPPSLLCYAPPKPPIRMRGNSVTPITPTRLKELS